MMHAVEIQEHARKMLDAMGATAVVEAAQKAKVFEEQGRKDDAKDWRRIEAALRQLQGPRVS